MIFYKERVRVFGIAYHEVSTGTLEGVFKCVKSGGCSMVGCFPSEGVTLKMRVLRRVGKRWRPGTWRALLRVRNGSSYDGIAQEVHEGFLREHSWESENCRHVGAGKSNVFLGLDMRPEEHNQLELRLLQSVSYPVLKGREAEE